MGFPKHPIYSGSTFGLMSGEKPLFQPQVPGGHEALGQALQQMGLHAEATSGKYAEPERSYIVHGATLPQMQQLGKMFGQESVVHSENGQHRLVYTNGEHEGKYHASDPQNPIEHFEQPPEDFYTSLPGHGHARINFDFSKMHHLDPVNKAEREYEPELAAYLLKNAVADLLANQAPARPHPHAYDWHDGHSSHHEEDLAGPQLPGLTKADAPGVHPHMDAPPKPVNDQLAPAGSTSTYRQFALPYGNVQPGSKPDLLHYNYHGKLPEVEGLVQDHGYKTYYGGGKYGKPDLANKNYNTGHLMVYDPSPSSGGDFGHEHYTNAWRQIHELAHAQTLPELNKIYGEGRRMGKLGTHRNLNEALRAVHWEWLAAHKQRDLSKQIGVDIKDEDFHKELNTVMHDAAHRAVTGKFTEPSGEGFSPHSHKVPLHTALQMVRDAGNQMGLKGLHDLVPRGGLQKAEIPGLASPAAAGVTAKPALHNNLASFHAALKAHAPGSPEHTGLLAAHAYHDPLHQDLKRYGASGEKIANAMKQAHSSAVSRAYKAANSTANAGFKPGATKLTVKSEPMTKDESRTRHGAKPYKCDTCGNVAKINTNHTMKVYSHPCSKCGPSREHSYAGSVGAAHAGGGEATEPKSGHLKVVKSEAPAVIFSKTEGDKPVADNKMYTPEEARDILIKSAREKIDSYAKEIEALSAREMKKSAVEQHKHHPAQTMGGGPECVSAGAQRGEGKAKGKGPAGLYQSEGKLSKEVLCKKCGKSHELDKCGEMEKALGPFGGFSPTLDQAAKDNQKQALKGKNKDSRGYYKNPDAWKKPKEEVESKPEDPAKKSELVDAKGKKSDNHTVAGSKDSEGKSAHVNKPGKSSKTAGSGGVILPGANLKKSANPPMAKPPSGVNMGTGVPTSAPKAPKAPTAAPMAKGVLTDAARQADPISAAHAAHTAPKAAPPKSPTPEQHAQRAAGFQAAAGGAFQPPAPAPKPAATKPAIPGLASPKAAGVTRSAGPVLNAARPAPAAAKPGIFGKLFGKKP